MVIRRIEICNFRLFYKNNVFELSDGLNLIVGANGCGKTTFFDALEWLFHTDGTNKMDSKNISKKRIGELSPNDSDDLRVAMTYEHRGRTKVLEKMFHFTKSFDGEVTTSNYSFSLLDGYGVERFITDGVAFDKDLPSDIRKFSMFKEEGGDVFLSSNSLRLLVDNFSKTRDFDAYCAFMEFATTKADQARDNAQKIDKKNSEKLKQLRKTIEQDSTTLANIEKEIKIKENEAANFDDLLKNIEQGMEASKLLVAVNRRIDSLSQKRSETAARIREDYSRRLLDDMWVLVGFDKIASEYSKKVNELGKERQRLEGDYWMEIGIAKAMREIEQGNSPLTELTQFFKHNFIGELQLKNFRLLDNLPMITKLGETIQKSIALNNRLYDDIKKIEANLAMEFEQKKRILTQTDGLSEEQLLANYENNSDWMDKKNRAYNRIDILKRQQVQHKMILEEAQTVLSKLSEDTSAAISAKIALMIRQISEAFKNAKVKENKRCLMTIEDKANMFLYQLLPDDFIGTIRILEKKNGQCEAILTDNDGSRIFNPNYSLRKASILAIMLALREIISENHDEDYPLIYDGSLSEYDNTFTNPLIDHVGGQMIVITSDFMKRDTSGTKKVDKEALPSNYAHLYHLEKRLPYDSKNMSTLQLSVSQVK